MSSPSKDPAKWIKGREHQDALKGPAGEVLRHKLQQAHLAGLSEAADARSLMTIGWDMAKGLDGTSIVKVGRSPKIVIEPKGFPLSTGQPTVEAELRRLADGTPQLWTSSLRHQLLAEGLIETVYRPCGRCAGDRITAKGLARIDAKRE